MSRALDLPFTPAAEDKTLTAFLAMMVDAGTKKDEKVEVTDAHAKRKAELLADEAADWKAFRADALSEDALSGLARLLPADAPAGFQKFRAGDIYFCKVAPFGAASIQVCFVRVPVGTGDWQWVLRPVREDKLFQVNINYAPAGDRVQAQGCVGVRDLAKAIAICDKQTESFKAAQERLTGGSDD